MRSMPYQRFWLTLFGLGNYILIYDRINYKWVTDTSVTKDKATRWTDDGEPVRVVSMSIISAYFDHNTSRIEISHTRKIGERDLLHELMHALSPSLPHEQIDIICEELIAARKRGDVQERI